MDQARELRCTECGAVSRDGRGWRAYFVGVGDEVDPDEEVVTYCPACAEREFGPR
jgi:ribosomal protein L44E